MTEKDPKPKGHLIRVLLADDDEFIRQGLMQLIGEDSSIKVVGCASDGEQAISLASTLKPDVVVMDLSMPALDGVAATQKILANGRDVAVVALSIYTDIARAREVIDAGAMAYVVKAGAQRYLISAIHAVANGNVFFSPGISGKLLENLRGTES